MGVLDRAAHWFEEWNLGDSETEWGIQSGCLKSIKQLTGLH